MAITLGILGGGQLAQMIAVRAKAQGYRVLLYAQSESEPACIAGFSSIIGGRNDSAKLKSFFSTCEHVILESEFYSNEFLKEISKETKTKIIPDIKAYSKLSTKKDQKEFFDLCQIKYANSFLIQNHEDLEKIKMTGPFMVKQSSGGYDGYGNQVVENVEELKALAPKFSNDYNNDLLVEEKLNIISEYACMLVKGSSNSVILPLCRTIQKNEVCELVTFPSELNTEEEAFINEAVQRMDDNLEGVGVFAFEFFKTPTGILINEAAPRVHNSYHFSIEGFSISQFDYIIDIINEKEIVAPRINYQYLSMVNLLGQSIGPEYKLTHPIIPNSFDFKTHMYGKLESRLGRKLGHLTFFGNEKNFEQAIILNNGYRI